jgi:hypothetical protein
MVPPFIHRTIQCRNPTNCNFADVGRQAGLCSDGAEEAVPAICNIGRVQQSEVQCQKGVRSAAGGEAGVDCRDSLSWTAGVSGAYGRRMV